MIPDRTCLEKVDTRRIPDQGSCGGSGWGVRPPSTEVVLTSLQFSDGGDRSGDPRAGMGRMPTRIVTTEHCDGGGDGNDLISELLRSEGDGQAVPYDFILGTVALTLIAGLDTTWSALGSAIWHLATHPDDTRRIVEDPALLPTAIEELLRAYSPVTMARIVVDDIEVSGCPMKAGDRVILNFPAANRDPAAFADADRVVIDRLVNRHVAFGAGIHRCAGSNLARMEMRVGLEEWLARIPSFRLADDAVVTWAGGQVRGPRQLPMIFP
jgi:cytochrome P450